MRTRIICNPCSTWFSTRCSYPPPSPPSPTPHSHACPFKIRVRCIAMQYLFYQADKSFSARMLSATCQSHARAGAISTPVEKARQLADTLLTCTRSYIPVRAFFLIKIIYTFIKKGRGRKEMTFEKWGEICFGY